MEDFLDDDEVDTSKIFRSSASGLTTVTSLSSTLSRFGYSEDDRIDRRDLVNMYSSVKKEMEKEISRLALTSSYSSAKEMRARLTRLREEFDKLQTSGVQTVHKDQDSHFERAAKELASELKLSHEMQQLEVEKYIAKLKADQERYHAIQWENLELALSRIPRPRMKYCKRTQELIRAEHELIKLCQYDDAQKVRYMLERILPAETERFYNKFEKALESKRQNLREAQENDKLRLGEKLKGIKWTDVRRCELEKKICNQRLKNHSDDMAHAHILENKLKPEMSVKPSALWQKRQVCEYLLFVVLLLFR